MPKVNFKRELEREYGVAVRKINQVISKTGIDAWRVAVNETPAPPSPAGQEYQRTGRLRNGWKINTGSGAGTGLTPAIGSYVGKDPKVPSFDFDIRKNHSFQIWNNVPYASYVNDGLGNGYRTPIQMLEKAVFFFDSKVQLRFDGIK